MRLSPAGAIAAMIFLATPGWALAKGSNVEASLIAAGDAALHSVPLDVGIRLRMRPGWHVYWKNPGDSGLPPSVTWTLPEGFQAGPIEWPAPTRFLDGGLVTYGYCDEVILPVRIQTPGRIDAESVLITARVDWLECKDVCVPGSATMRLRLPVRVERGMVRPSTMTMARARSRLPAERAGWVLIAESGPRAVSLSFKPRGTRPRRAYFYADHPLVVDYASPQGFERSGQLWRVTMTPAPNADRNLNRLTGVLVTDGEGGPKAVQVEVPLQAGDPAPAPPQPLMPPQPPSWAAYAAILGGVAVVLALLVPRIRRRTQRI